MKKSKIMISHGNVTHSFDDRDDCLECIDVQIEYLQMLKKVGGQKNLIKELNKKIELV